MAPHEDNPEKIAGKYHEFEKQSTGKNTLTMREIIDKGSNEVENEHTKNISLTKNHHLFFVVFFRFFSAFVYRMR